MCRRLENLSKWTALFGATLLMPLLLLGTPTTAAAFGLQGLDARVGVTNPEGVDGTLALGAGLNFQEPGSHVHIMPNVMYWSEDGLSDVNANVDASYHFERAGRVSPYLGAGLGMHFYSSDGPGDPGTDLGANLFGGLMLPTSGPTFNFEARAVVADRSQFGFLTGVTFNLGR